MEAVALDLFSINAIKFGKFTLKSGLTSPVYVDLRVVSSSPKVLKALSDLIYSKIQEHVLPKYTPENHRVKLCGVPYSALTFATGISVMHDMPMILVRKESKEYGTKNMVEGLTPEDTPDKIKAVIIEDVVTSGLSILETVDKLESLYTEEQKKGNKLVEDVVFVLDREQGGKQTLKKKGFNVHSLLTLSEVAKVLAKHGKISSETEQEIYQYVSGNQVTKEPTPATTVATTLAPAAPAAATRQLFELSFEERAQLCKNGFGKALFQLMEAKKTNLSLAADVTSSKELLALAEEVGPEICLLKTHVDILEDFTEEVAKQLTQLAFKHNFFIFEDRKFADIGKVVKCQYGGGIYKIASWSHLTNAHLVSGASIVKGLRETLLEQRPKKEEALFDRGLLLLAKMSTVDTQTNADTEKVAYKIAQENKDFVCGFICQGRIASNQLKETESFTKEQREEELSFIYATPGVNIAETGDSLGQNYNTPEIIVQQKKSDIIIVGSGIVSQKDRRAAAAIYRTRGWQAYQNRIKQ